MSDLRGICQLSQLLLSHPAVELDPPSPGESSFQEDFANLVQINVLGRILRVSFMATPEIVSSEDFRVPYTLNGTVRAFNPLLDKKISNSSLSSIPWRSPKMWRFFDARTYRAGPFYREYLITLMEQLL